MWVLGPYLQLQFWAPWLLPVVAWWCTKTVALQTRDKYWRWKKEWMQAYCSSEQHRQAQKSVELDSIDKSAPKMTVAIDIALDKQPLLSPSVFEHSEPQHVKQMMDIWKGREYPLWDLLHFKALEFLLKYRWVSDGLVLCFPSLVVILSVDTAPLLSCLLSSIYILRPAFFSITVLVPCNPDVHITAEHWHHDTALPPAGKLLFTGFGVDLIFSGHTSLMVTSLYVLRDDCHVSREVFHVLVLLAVLVSLYIVLSHCHYSICVSVSWIVSKFAYDAWHDPWRDWLSSNSRTSPTDLWQLLPFMIVFGTIAIVLYFVHRPRPMQIN